MKIYMVGGAVRDQLLGREVQDRDWVVVGASANDLLAAGYLPVGKDFPVFLHPKTREEVALARTERKTAPGYHGFSFHADPAVTLEEDLARRDLTINAIVLDDAGNFIDPYGGQQDLQNKVLRHVTQAFAEDPVRILRVARFAARYVEFTVAPETMQLMRRMVDAGEVDALIAERVWQEISRGLMEEKPSRMFEVLHDCGALAKILPEIEKRFGAWQLIPKALLKPGDANEDLAATISHQTLQALRVDRKNVWAEQALHTLHALDLCASSKMPLPVRFACMAYDAAIADMVCLDVSAADDKDFLSQIKALSERLRVPVECRELAVLAQQFTGQIHTASQFSAEDVMQLFKHTDAFRQPQRFHALLNAVQMDACAYPEQLGITYSQAQQLDELLQQVLALDTKSIALATMAAGAKGEAVGAAIDAARLVVIKNVWTENARASAEAE